jgi:hypothetical protein
MPGTLPPARARVLTRAGLLARLWVTSTIDFHFSYAMYGQTGPVRPPAPVPMMITSERPVTIPL